MSYIGPNQPEIIHRFFKPIVDDFVQLEAGIPRAIDASKPHGKAQLFTLRAVLVGVVGDQRAVDKVIGMKGSGAVFGCRMCLHLGM